MWTFTTPAGVAKIQCDSLTGHFLAFFNNDCEGSFYTPQEAAYAFGIHHPLPRSSEYIPADLNCWDYTLSTLWYDV